MRIVLEISEYGPTELKDNGSHGRGQSIGFLYYSYSPFNIAVHVCTIITPLFIIILESLTRS